MFVCHSNFFFSQKQNVKEEPVQTRRGKLRNAAIETLKPVSPRRPLHRNKENTDRYLPGS